LFVFNLHSGTINACGTVHHNKHILAKDTEIEKGGFIYAVHEGTVTVCSKDKEKTVCLQGEPYLHSPCIGYEYEEGR
jgi:hypothetical protein